MRGSGWTAALVVAAAVAACGGSRTEAVRGATAGTLVDVACEGNVPPGSRCATLAVL